MDRILVLGPCGAGKSTLARKIGTMLDLPVIHLDSEYHQPNWVPTPDPEWFAKVEEIAARPRWVIDGNYGSTLGLRLKRADQVVILDFPRRVFFPRMVWRTLSRLGRTRVEMAQGCVERIDLEFWRYTWRYRIDSMPEHEQLVAASGLPVIRPRSPAEVKRWLGHGAPSMKM